MSHNVVRSIWWWIVANHVIQIAIAVIYISVMRQVDDGLLRHVTVALAHIGRLVYVGSCRCKGSLRLWQGRVATCIRERSCVEVRYTRCAITAGPTAWLPRPDIEC